MCRVDELPAFKGLRAHITENTRDWQKFYDNPKPHLENPPAPFDALNNFHRMMLLRCLRTSNSS